MNIPEFDTRKELFEFLIKNKNSLIAQKKAITKHTDCINYVSKIYEKDETGKALNKIDLTKDEFLVSSVMNTTNVIDSHMDLHINGLWNKTLKENKMLMHLQEHKMSFSKIISDGKDLKVKTELIAFKDLGYKLDGETQALIFNSKIRKERNPFMFEQYGKGYVKNHSVGMRYVKLLMAINDEQYETEYEVWEKYYPMVANKNVADSTGYFWVVKEAKLIEGSAVPLGSNSYTPTLNIEQKDEPLQDTQPEPIKFTQQLNEFKNLLKI